MIHRSTTSAATCLGVVASVLLGCGRHAPQDEAPSITVVPKQAPSSQEAASGAPADKPLLDTVGPEWSHRGDSATYAPGHLLISTLGRQRTASGASTLRASKRRSAHAALQRGSVTPFCARPECTLGKASEFWRGGVRREMLRPAPQCLFFGVVQLCFHREQGAPPCAEKNKD